MGNPGQELSHSYDFCLLLHPLADGPTCLLKETRTPSVPDVPLPFPVVKTRPTTQAWIPPHSPAQVPPLICTHLLSVSLLGPSHQVFLLSPRIFATSLDCSSPFPLSFLHAKPSGRSHLHLPTSLTARPPSSLPLPLEASWSRLPVILCC